MGPARWSIEPVSGSLRVRPGRCRLGRQRESGHLCPVVRRPQVTAQLSPSGKVNTPDLGFSSPGPPAASSA